MSAGLEARIEQWRRHVDRATAIRPGESDELEAHLRDEIDTLRQAGLDEDEAFLIGVRRLGAIDALSAEFARTNSARLWKQLVLPAPTAAGQRPGGLWWALGIGLVAAVGFQLLYGLTIGWPARPTGDGSPLTIALCLLIPVAALAAWLLIRRRASRLSALAALAPIAIIIADIAVATVLLGETGGEWFGLLAIHTPIAAWLGVGIAYLGDQWRGTQRRMDLVRFTGEFAIYYTLIALGGGVLFGITSAIIAPLAPGSLPWLTQWGLGSCAIIAVPVAGWLVDAKQSVIENLAPILARIFLPLVAIVGVTAAVLYAIDGVGRGFDRDFIVILDVLLVLVLGLVLYNLSARAEGRWTPFFDATGLLAIVGALALDAMLLADLIARIGEYGWTANRVAAVGLNVLLVIVLAGAALVGVLRARDRSRVARLESWLMATLPAYSLWGAFVVIVLPLAFGTA